MILPTVWDIYHIWTLVWISELKITMNRIADHHLDDHLNKEQGNTQEYNLAIELPLSQLCLPLSSLSSFITIYNFLFALSWKSLTTIITVIISNHHHLQLCLHLCQDITDILTTKRQREAPVFKVRCLFGQICLANFDPPPALCYMGTFPRPFPLDHVLQ